MIMFKMEEYYDFDDNTAYQLYRIFVAIFGTLGMVVATSPMKKTTKKICFF